MSSTTGDFSHESLQDAESIVEYIEALAQGFASGRLLFSSGKKEIQLRPSGLLELSVRAKRKDGTTRISVEVSWKEPRTRKRKSPPLKIEAPKKRG